MIDWVKMLDCDAEFALAARKQLEKAALDDPETLVYMEDARKYLGWNHVTTWKRFRRLRLPVYPVPRDKRVKQIRLVDLLWIEEVFLASHKGQWADPGWWYDVRQNRNTCGDFAFTAPLPMSVGGYDPRHPSNLSPEEYDEQYLLREYRRTRYAKYMKRNP